VSTVLVSVHPDRDQARDLEARAAAWLAANGHEATDDPTAADLVLAVALGGDGTMLRTVDAVADRGVPVLGVNVGQLGYLTEVEPDELEHALARYFAGDHLVEDRMMLAVSTERDGEVVRSASCALNEAVLEKTPMGHTVRLSVSIDGEHWADYNCDGLIVATPTGSTAYSLSAGGPIVAPEHRALVFTPVSPHSLFDRSLVFDPATSLRLEVCGPRRGTLSVDGRNLGELDAGEAIVCTAAERTARLVTFGARNFHQILKRKFRLS
jgi:NAD+ kinase